jgi:hypothetical protein
MMLLADEEVNFWLGAGQASLDCCEWPNFCQGSYRLIGTQGVMRVSCAKTPKETNPKLEYPNPKQLRDVNPNHESQGVCLKLLILDPLNWFESPISSIEIAGLFTLGVLCVPSASLRTCFARVIFFRFRIQPKIQITLASFYGAMRRDSSKPS